MANVIPQTIGTIGRFEVRDELGRGAQSIVYLGWDPQLHREVAIKTLHLEASGTEAKEFLLAESRAVSKLKHPNIVSIFDAGEQDGDPYLVFELVEGGNLAGFIKRAGIVPPVQAATIMSAVLGAIAQAHAQGIIHRDLKPSNILMDANGIPKVMDFGIAVHADSSAKFNGGLTGTPAFMTPEYVSENLVTPQGDIYAAGLVLLEMLTGRRVFEGDTMQVLYKVVNEKVALPPGTKIDERLADIALKASAKNPEARYSSAEQMKQALDDYLSAGAGGSADSETKQATLDFLLRRMRHKSDFPALSDSVSAINRLTSSDMENIDTLSTTILKDFALTNKILRMVNSAHFRQAGAGSINTISRAVVVLGFDAIRNIAITVLLFEHLQDKGNARELKESFLRANLAGLLGREAAQQLKSRATEESFICSMFHGLGELLAQFYFPEESIEVQKLMQQKKLSSEIASSRVLGLSFEELGVAIAKAWGFPSGMVNSMRRLPAKVRKPATHDDMLQVVAGFSHELCEIVSGAGPDDYRQAAKDLTERFSASLQLSEKQVKGLLETSLKEVSQIAGVLQINLKQSPLARRVKELAGTSATLASKTDLADQTLLDDTVLLDQATAIPVRPEQAPAGEKMLDLSPTEGEHIDAVPDHAQQVLTAGIQDISNSLIEDFQLNDVLRITLETMYRAMGFQRVILCLRNSKTNTMVGRFGFGQGATEIAKQFNFPLTQATDVFLLAMTKPVDLLISDVDDPKIADRIPAWYRERIFAKTFALFPLVIKEKPVGLIYCEREKAGSIVIPEKELTLLKTLRNQALIAIKQSTPR
ncbi:MAG: HDOD domain-containing protein [Proteobacteria bacterium]|nr:HDOD domain-containing protein [Pseudomonadota bacterium]